jgi:iron complex transport system substrate-binding protein
LTFFSHANASRSGVQARPPDFSRKLNRRPPAAPFAPEQKGDGFSLSKTTRFFAQVFILLLFAALCACRYQSPRKPMATGDEMRQATDQTGRRISLPAQPKRVISLAPNLTEIVYALGAGDKLIGVTTYCNYPQAAQSVEKVGDTLKPNAERIIALQPDVVLVSTASQLEAFTKQLEAQGIAVYVTQPKDLAGMLRSLTDLGDLLNARARAEALSNELLGRIEDVEEAVKGKPPVSVFVQISGQPLYTAGRDSWLTDMIKRAGGQSVTAEVAGEWPNYSNESALAAKPEAIILSTDPAMANAEPAEALKNSPAVKNNRVYRVNGDLLARPGPRLVNGLEEIAKALHTESRRQAAGGRQ